MDYVGIYGLHRRYIGFTGLRMWFGLLVGSWGLVREPPGDSPTYKAYNWHSKVYALRALFV